MNRPRSSTILKLMIAIAVFALVLSRSEFWCGRVSGGLELQSTTTFGPCRFKATAISNAGWYELRFDLDPSYRFAR